ncbi:hypothetical protein HPB50_002026 [Hyalomma asiaticum]|uniref:Uncharacterized protein n=1 Tax=Hyalomma asiaticum TaxID=266040 RepID=A0ACB7T5L0_HYAAI|nr:hypothetical protein HPB50_002026 [Hyalomma asiaticum]
MANAEQYELLRETIHRLTNTFRATLPLRVFITGPARYDRTCALLLVIDVYNHYKDVGQHNGFRDLGEHGKGVGGSGSKYRAVVSQALA